MASESHYTYTLHQYIDETSLASLHSIIRGEKPLLSDDRVRIADVASALTLELALAQEHITRLQTHCSVVRQQLTLYQSAVAPIRNLPYDVLISIFEHTLHEESENRSPTTKAPWTLAQVCCSWREIVLSARGLWAIVKYNSRRDTINAEVIQEHLRRSGQHPLTIVLRGVYRIPIYDLILKESFRWKILCVEQIDSAFASCLSSLPPESISQLEELHIREDDNYHCQGVLRAPQLKRLSVSHYTGLLLGCMERITHYAAPLAMIELNTLSVFPSLVFCHISISDNHLSIVGSASPLVCSSSLKHLEIRNGFNVLDRLVLPALITLCLNEHQVPPAASAGSVIQAFIQRSSCTLTTLTIWPSHHDGIELLRLPCLEGLVNLHFAVNYLGLEFDCQEITSSIFSSTSVLPHLSTLTVNIENMNRLLPAIMREVPSWATLIDILERRHAAGRLKTLRILHEYDLPLWMMRDLTALSQRSGLHIEDITKAPLPGFFRDKEFLTSELWYRS